MKSRACLLAQTGAILCSACQPSPPEAATSETTTSSAAVFGEPSQFWPLPGSGGSIPTANHIPVCWEPPTLNNSQVATVRSRVQDSWSRNWSRFSRITLVGSGSGGAWAACSPGQPGLHLYIDPPQAGDQNTQLGIAHNGVDNGLRLPECGVAGGPGPGQICQDAFGFVTAQDYCIRDIALHGFGHFLGFYHTEQSLKYNYPNPIDASCNATSVQPGARLPGDNKTFGAYNELSVMSLCGGDIAGEGEEDFCLPDLVPHDLAAAQRVYGRRIPGSLVTTKAKCAEDNGGPKMFDCDEFGDVQEWDYTFSNRTLRNVSTNNCLQAPSSCSSTQITTAACNGSLAAQQWTFDRVFIRGWGAMCLDLAFGDTNGGVVNIFQCDAVGADGTLGGNQKWTIGTDRRIRFGADQTKCLEVPSSGNGQLHVTSCSTSSRQVFVFEQTPTGSIKSAAFPTKCLDVQGSLDSDYINGIGDPANGLPVSLFDCSGAQFNQKWNFSGGFIKPGNCATKCLRRSSSANNNGTSVTLGSCAPGDDTAAWDYYPL